MQYQTIETLGDYLLIDSSAVAVMHFRRQGEVWMPQLLEEVDDEVRLPGLGIALPLRELYLDTGLIAD